uniref:Uncharacterized protein n=1 Tax=Arundo donax TaxID=35708 RepID=A0A0A9EN90_ARUDO
MNQQFLVSVQQKSTTASHCLAALLLPPFPRFLRIRQCPQPCSACLCLILPLVQLQPMIISSIVPCKPFLQHMFLLHENTTAINISN